MQKVTRFTEAQMGAIIEVIKDHGEVAGVEKTWEILLGEPLETYEGRVNPTRYAIPRTQAHALCGEIIAREKAHPSHTAMPGGTWMNYGPSSFEEVGEVIHKPGDPEWLDEPDES